MGGVDSSVLVGFSFVGDASKTRNMAPNIDSTMKNPALIIKSTNIRFRMSILYFTATASGMVI